MNVCITLWPLSLH